MSKLTALRESMRPMNLAADNQVLEFLQQESSISEEIREKAQRQAQAWASHLRDNSKHGLMDVFMAEYGLSNEEGIALMCLAEALLRVPDAETMDALIEDKIVPSDWASHLGRSASPLVNASTWALLLTGKVLDDEKPVAGVLQGMIKRLGEPVTRLAVNRAMRELGEQFVLGESIEAAIERGNSYRQRGYTYSYDMLGEAARTAEDAEQFFQSYLAAIRAIKPHCLSADVRKNPGISIKLSALFERYEELQIERVRQILVPRVVTLAIEARNAGLGLNIDAEEAARLELSMDVIETVMRNPALHGWDGFGIVVQAYGKRARFVIDWFYELASELDRRVMLRLVKGAYWDTDIKLAQVEGLGGFPVFATKPATDISYLENAAHLFKLGDRIYPQFATHNAHTIALIEALPKGDTAYEFQKLHGMGDSLYDEVIKSASAPCRIYAPVGIHEDLLAYLVRRLLENGANSSFVNQILDPTVSVTEVVADPHSTYPNAVTAVIEPNRLFGERLNSRGFDINDRLDLHELLQARDNYAVKEYQDDGNPDYCELFLVQNPATGDKVGSVSLANESDVDNAVASAEIWKAPVQERAAILRRAADLYEANHGEIFALLCREAGKTLMDAIAELREAVDFLRFYADQAEAIDAEPRGLFACISPWNFPLAIFTGQIAAALSAGNGVLAKPAESTSLIALRAVGWLHEAGVPQNVLQLLPGRGQVVGNALSCHAAISGVCFTGSTATAKLIHQNMAANLAPDATLIAETGGLNAMIVDSTALPEQAVRDIVISAFQSAGQRCSALRLLCVQEDIADKLLTMLYGAMDALQLGDPWDTATDIGPVIDERARGGIVNHIKTMASEGRVSKSISAPGSGFFVGPTVIELDSISQLEEEIFGPVLHVVKFAADELQQVIDDINNSGYGLTFGMHSRIDHHVNLATTRIKAGNLYINRNQIGAIVGSQPFGGEGLSGTGPKAGGPLYLHRFFKNAEMGHLPKQSLLPGPTGESNEWAVYPKGTIFCAGPGDENAKRQAEIARDQGCDVLINGDADETILCQAADINAVIYWGENGGDLKRALAAREGPIVPFVTAHDFAPYCWLERHVCVDTTASGGNVELLAGS